MLPKYHIFLGILLLFIIMLLCPNINLLGILLLVISSVIVDIDHYLTYVLRKKDFSLRRAYKWHNFIKKVIEKRCIKRGVRKKYLNVFHTIEFHLLLVFLSFFHSIFIFILIGLVFHSLIDIIELRIKKRLYLREYFLIRYLIKGRKRYF